MQWSLVAVVLIVNALFGASCASAENGKGQISSVFEAFGYSPACVASALTSCEFSSTKELSIDVVDSIEETKSLLQEMKSEIKDIRQEMKSAEGNSSSVVKSLLQEMKSEIGNSVNEIKPIRQEMKFAEKNSSSVVTSLLQEIKSERENEKKSFEILLDNIEKITHRISSLEISHQEIKSEGENTSTVVKSLFQEIKSQRENSVSEIKTLLQEVKTEQQNEKRKSDEFDAVINSKPKNCADLRVLLGDEFSGGVQTVYPYGFPNQKPVVVFCDQTTLGGGWTVIQNRSPLLIRENFYRNWTEYVEGFGDLTGEFWIGLDNIHALTNSAQMQLRVDLEDAAGKKAWALYSTFHVGDAASKYVLRIGGYSGTAGDGMTIPSNIYANLNGMKFSTQDNDNDLGSGYNCAEQYKGGWWFNQCHVAQLNGLPIVGSAPYGDGIRWDTFRGLYSMKRATMRIRPVSLGF